MDPATAQLIVALMGMAMEYGAPAVMQAIAALQKDAITLEDVEALKGLIKPPEAYT